MAEEFLNCLQVPCLVEHLLSGSVAGFVHPLAGGHPGGDDGSALEAAVPPVVGAVVSHRLLREPVDDGGALARDRFLAGEQVVVGLGLEVKDQPLEVEPEVGLRDGKLTDLFALCEDRQAPTLVVEVPELDPLEGAFSQPVVEEENSAVAGAPTCETNRGP